MKIKWKELGLDALSVVTLPLWIVPALVVLLVGHLVLCFMDKYVE
jgi:hypothetical protein